MGSREARSESEGQLQTPPQRHQGDQCPTHSSAGLWSSQGERPGPPPRPLHQREKTVNKAQQPAQESPPRPVSASTELMFS